MYLLLTKITNQGTIMNIDFHNKHESGFAILESLLILMIIGGVVGIGGYVIKQKNSVKASVETSTSSTPTSVSKETIATPSTASKLTVVNSTNSDINKLISDESDTEFNLDKSSDSESLTKIDDSNRAANNVGDSFNENDL